MSSGPGIPHHAAGRDPHHPSLRSRAARLACLALVAAALVVSTMPSSRPEESAFGGGTVDRRAFERAERIAAADLQVVDNGDGTWSYAVPAGFDPSIRVRGNVLTWRYAGQARYSHEPTFGATRYFTVPEHEDAPSSRETVAAMRRIDAHGRIWQVESVDERAWERSGRDDAVERAEAVHARGANPAADPDEEAGTVIAWHPLSWDHDDCAAGGGFFQANEAHFWDGDGRTQILSGHTDRQKTAVMIRNNFGSGTSYCSGVMVRSKQVLTAAHCVSDDSNNPVPVNEVQVCRDDISPNPCLTAADIDLSASYGGGSGSGGGTDFGDDWAVIELESSWATAGFSSPGRMKLSSAGNDTLRDLTSIHNLAFPGFVPGCTAVSLPPTVLIHNEENQRISGVTSKRIKMKIDGTPGHSGSPIYYCPDGDNNVCGPGETGYVIAVFAGWNSVANRWIGPKVAAFRDAANAFMDD